MNAERELEQCLRRVDRAIDLQLQRQGAGSAGEDMARVRRRPHSAPGPRRANPPPGPIVSDLIRRLDQAPANYRLTAAERVALRNVVQQIVTKNIPLFWNKPNATEQQRTRTGLQALVNLGRFRFLQQIPKQRAQFIRVLEGTGVELPPSF